MITNEALIKELNDIEDLTWRLLKRECISMHNAKGTYDLYRNFGPAKAATTASNTLCEVISRLSDLSNILEQEENKQ